MLTRAQNSFPAKSNFLQPAPSWNKKSSCQTCRQLDNQVSLLRQFSVGDSLLSIFRHGELAGVAVLGTAQHENTIPNVLSVAHSGGCLPYLRFAQKGRVLRDSDNERWNSENRYQLSTRASLFPVISGRFLRATMRSISVAPPNRMNSFFMTGLCYLIRVLANCSTTNPDGTKWRRSLSFTGAGNCPMATEKRREWGFYWRGQLSRKQMNSGKQTAIRRKKQQKFIQKKRAIRNSSNFMMRDTRLTTKLGANVPNGCKSN